MEKERKNIQYSDDNIGWMQRVNAEKAAEKKNVNDNIVKDDIVLHRSVKEAKKEENKQYAEKAEQSLYSSHESFHKKQREADDRRIVNGIHNRNNVEKQIGKTEMRKTFSPKEVRRIEQSNEDVGKSKPLKNKERKEVRSLNKSKEKSDKKISRPSERLNRIRGKTLHSRLKELSNKRNKEAKTVEKTALKTAKNIEKTDVREPVKKVQRQKYSLEYINKLRGLDKNKAASRVKDNFKEKERAASKNRSRMVVRKREGNER